MSKDLLSELTLPADIEAEFRETYTDVKLLPRMFAGHPILRCDRCNAYVSPHSDSSDVHKLWHRNNSLAVWLLQKFVVEHSKAHVTFGTEMHATISREEMYKGGD